MSEKHEIIPVWFFVGVLFLIYGVLIFGSGLAEWSHPPNTVGRIARSSMVGRAVDRAGRVYCSVFRPGGQQSVQALQIRVRTLERLHMLPVAARQRR